MCHTVFQSDRRSREQIAEDPLEVQTLTSDARASGPKGLGADVRPTYLPFGASRGSVEGAGERVWYIS